MEETRKYGCHLLFLITSSCFLILVSIANSVQAYKNHTVGDSLGWYDTLQKPDLNYHKWAAANNFSLGDFLIFNTDTNHSVIQTYNVTTYKLCDYDNAVENDTIQWSSADPSNTAPHDVSVAVPLVKEGTTYFFSGDYDGEQCKNGQHFKINVTHGQGLPKSLEQNPESSGPASSPQSGNGDDEPTPDTIVPNSNFNNPKQDAADDTQPSGSVSFSLPHVQGNLISILVGLVYLCCS